MTWDRIKTLLLVLGWGVAGLAVYMNKQHSPFSPTQVEQTKTEVVEQAKVVDSATTEHTKTLIKKTDGTVIVIEKNRDNITKSAEQSKAVRAEQTKTITSPKPQHSLAVQFKPDFKTMTFKPQELTYGYRLTGDLWITTGVTMKKDFTVGLRADF